MSSKTKIVVLKMKEIIYTAIFIVLGILLAVLIFFMFRPKKASDTKVYDSPVYTPGVYVTPMIIGGHNMNVEVTVDSNYITSINMTYDEVVETLYPLMQPTLTDLAEQICQKQSTDNLSYSSETQYTAQALINTIDMTLKKAAVKTR